MTTTVPRDRPMVLPTTGSARWPIPTAALLTVLSAALPFVLLTNPNPWAHALFHIIGIGLCLAALATQQVWRRTATRPVRVLSWLVSGSFLVWLFGHTGELVIVLMNGAFHADEHVFEDPAHSFFAGFAIPGWMLAVVLSLAQLITAGIRALIRRRTAA